MADATDPNPKNRERMQTGRRAVASAAPTPPCGAAVPAPAAAIAPEPPSAAGDTADDLRASIASLRAASEVRYRNLADAIPHVVFTTDADGDADYHNAQWFALTGLDAAASRGWGWTRALHPEDAARVVPAWREALRAGAAYETECRFLTARGAYRWHLCRALPERDARGAVVAWIATCTDIDDRKRVEAERAQHLRDAEAMLRGRDDFIALASHELKTPLTALRLNVKSLARRLARVAPSDPAAATTERARDAAKLAAVDRQIDRLVRLVDGLLDISRATAGGLQLELGEVDLAAVVRAGVASAADELARAGCAVALRAESPVTGRWDRARLEQVVAELVANAMKYGVGRPIDVAVYATGDTARLVVRDRGVGVAREDQARIFERFERVVAAERQRGGLGLGLWLARQIVRAHGGDIAIESDRGAGSAFTVELPRRGARSSAVAPEPAAAAHDDDAREGEFEREEKGEE